MSVDVAGYSRLMGEDEAGTRSKFNECLNLAVKPALGEHAGRLVKTMGDGFLVEFASVLGAVQAAVDIQSEWSHRQHCLLYTSPSPRDVEESRMPSSA